jgi:iron complex outermembrane receptor protein
MPAIEAPQPQAAPTIIVVGTREAAHRTANSVESVTIEQLRRTVNLRNSEDSLRYLPSLFVRKRHTGDTQAPVATRTSGVGSSARSLVYADGVLLSALIGNNNNFASPRWGMVSPEEIERVDILYGPFSAAYPGNSIGAVVNITTRLPRRLEATLTSAANLEQFRQYATRGEYPTGQLSATLGDVFGPVAWFVSANHVESKAQPLSYVTVNRPSSASTAGLPLTGAFEDLSRTGVPIEVIGAGAIEHQRQNNVKAKLALELPAAMKFTWQTGLFLNETDAHAESYLRTATGAPVYSGEVNIGGRAVTIAPSAFSSQVYRLSERHWMNSAALEQDNDAYFWSLIGSLYHYAKDDQRIPALALPDALTGGAGSIVRLGGTGWKTLDLHGYTRTISRHELHAGAHYDGFTLKNLRYSTRDWIEGSAGSLQQEALGRTRTLALWGEDHWTFAPQLMLTLGARYEWWCAYRGRNFSASPALDVIQPSRNAEGISPKASLHWEPARKWSLTVSAGRALRFPTVSELYQAVATGPTISIPNPDLLPEKALSGELAVQRDIEGGRVRLSLFREDIRHALVAQAAPLNGSTQLFNYVQNIDRTRTNGLELVAEKRNLLPRIDFSGSLTLADPRTVSDALVPAARNKLIPQVPRRRATLLATFRANRHLSLTSAVRYSSRLFATIDNSDIVGHTYQGFEGFLIADARATYRLTQQIDVAVGAENLTDKRYFLFHPFPGRTFTAELHWHR